MDEVSGRGRPAAHGMVALLEAVGALVVLARRVGSIGFIRLVCRSRGRGKRQPSW